MFIVNIGSKEDVGMPIISTNGSQTYKHHTLNLIFKPEEELTASSAPFYKVVADSNNDPLMTHLVDTIPRHYAKKDKVLIPYMIRTTIIKEVCKPRNQRECTPTPPSSFLEGNEQIVTPTNISIPKERLGWPVKEHHQLLTIT